MLRPNKVTYVTSSHGRQVILFSRRRHHRQHRVLPHTKALFIFTEQRAFDNTRFGVRSHNIIHTLSVHLSFSLTIRPAHPHLHLHNPTKVTHLHQPRHQQRYHITRDSITLATLTPHQMTTFNEREQKFMAAACQSFEGEPKVCFLFHSSDNSSLTWFS